MESRPICLRSALRRRLNSSRPMALSGGAVGSARRRVPRADTPAWAAPLVDGRGTGNRLLTARGRELHEQQLHTDAHEFHDLGERDLVLFGLLAGIHAYMSDL